MTLFKITLRGKSENMKHQTLLFYCVAKNVDKATELIFKNDKREYVTDYRFDKAEYIASVNDNKSKLVIGYNEGLI